MKLSADKKAFCTARVIQYCIDQYPAPPTSVHEMRRRRIDATNAVVGRWFLEPEGFRYNKTAYVTYSLRSLIKARNIAHFDELLYHHCRNIDRELADQLLRCFLPEGAKTRTRQGVIGGSYRFKRVSP